MDPELTTNLEVEEMNVDRKTNVDQMEDIDKKKDVEKDKIVEKSKDIANKTEDGDKRDKKIEKENVDKKTNVDKIEDLVKKEDVEKDKTVENDISNKPKDVDKPVKKREKELNSIESKTRLKTESVVTELPKVVKNTRTDIIPTTKALVEKKPSKFKLWFFRTFFFRKFNKSKKDLKHNRHDLTITESGVEHSTPVTPSTSSSSVTPINETIPEEKLEKPRVCAPVSVVIDPVTERGIIE